MQNLLKSVCLIAAFSGIAIAPARLASAQDVQLRIGPDGIRPEIRDRDRDRDRDRRRGCSEREARSAARDSGLRNPEVVRVTPTRVVVEGMTRRGPDRITFANERGCPEL